MLVLFVCTAVLAWLALCRLMGDRWIALTATLMAFSSFWLLYFNDMVSEAAPSLFGMMLAFHGMVVFVQEGRFRQLLAKACAALLLGWHVYALLLPFIVLGLVRELIRAQPLFGPGRLNRVRAVVRTSMRYLTLGVVTLLFGAVLLSFNLGNEYLAFGGRIPLIELPSVESMLRRTGWSDYFLRSHFGHETAWPSFLEEQIRRLGTAMFPFASIEPIWGSVEAPKMDSLRGMFTWGIAAIGACLTALPFVRYRGLWAALAVSGFCWAFPMRAFTAFHSFDAMFYVGIPLSFFSFICLCIRRLAGGRSVFVLAAAAAAIFSLSSVKMDSLGFPVLRTLQEAELMSDFQTIRDVLGEGVVYIPAGHDRLVELRIEYYLAGSVVLLAKQGRYRNEAGFLLLRHRDEGPALLTPDNRRVFLYDRSLYGASYDGQALGSPIITSDWMRVLEGRPPDLRR